MDVNCRHESLEAIGRRVRLGHYWWWRRYCYDCRTEVFTAMEDDWDGTIYLPHTGRGLVSVVVPL